MDPRTSGPVQPPDRIVALDAARGFALLGILLVNIQLFFMPLGYLIESRAPDGPGEGAAWWFLKVFCEGKFYPLFSMLFGMGLVLQLERARAAGRSFARLYVRRLAMLAAFGVAHIVLVWAGDILLVYSVAGLILLICARLGVRALLMCAGVLLVLAILLTAGAALLGVLGEPPASEPPAAASATAGTVRAPDEGPSAGPGVETGPPPADTVEPEPDSEPPGPFWQTPFGRLVRGFKSGTAGPPNSPLWMETETEAFRDGPFYQAMLFRLLNYTSFIMFMAFGFGWHVLAMFMIGAALMRLRLFAPERRVWHWRFVIVGVVLGLPLVLLSTVPPRLTDADWVAVVTAPIAMIGAPLMSLGYLGAVVLIATPGRAERLTRWLANAGRMALTVYLAESVAATFLSYHWGLGWFGRVSGPERIALAVGIYLSLVVISNLWLRAFRTGPMEWLWRRATYLRLREPTSP